jgi:1-phosphofructokinase
MIVTVTPNPAVDKTLIVPGFSAGKTNRGTIDRIDVGGKGINVARALRRFGCDVTATGFLADDYGKKIEAALVRQGIETAFVLVPGETRVNVKVIDPAAGMETEINEAGFQVPSEALAALTARLTDLARRASVMVFAGSLPPGVPAHAYGGFVRLARHAGVKTILDATGDVLKRGLAAGPDLVKPNRAEAEELLGASLDDEAALVEAARRLLEMGAQTAIVSLGPCGALSASAAGVWRARGPAVTARTTIGAGDAMVAALAYAMTRALAPREALRLATAASAAAAAGGEFPAAADVDSLLPQVVVEDVSTPADRAVRGARAAGAPQP